MGARDELIQEMNDMAHIDGNKLSQQMVDIVDQLVEDKIQEQTLTNKELTYKNEIIMSEQTQEAPRKRPGKFYLEKSDIDGQWYFNLRSGNGERIAVSEGYKSKQSAKDTILAIKDLAASAKLVVEED